MSATTGPGPAKSNGSSPYAGRTIARCKVGEKLGRGATSHVFRGFYEPLGKDVAVKILAKEAAGSAEMRSRFLSEARAVGKLNHENIVKVLDVVEDQSFLCILMELVAGPTLQDRLDDEEVIAPRHAFRIAGQIARALEAAHEQKVVHRDVKPANVMLVGKPGDETVKVVDFGLAAQQEMNRVGTPLFMSPEAAQGKRIDEKSDVYALGVCLYRMLTGVLPFTGATVKDILAAHVNAELVPPSERLPQIGKNYDELLKKLLVKSKGYRPTAAEAADLLEDVADDIEEREEGVRRVRRRKKKAPKKQALNPGVLVGVAVVAVVAVAFALFSGGGRPAANATPSTGPGTTATPAAAAVDPAQKDYEDTDAWIAANPANPANPAEAARRWGIVEKKYPGTAWGSKAGLKRIEAEEAKKAKEAADAELEKKRQAEREAAADPKVKLAKFEAMVKAFDFANAAAAMDSDDFLDPPAGVDQVEWKRRGQRLTFLARHFVDKMDAGIREARTPMKASELFPGSGAADMVVGVNSGGAIVQSGGERHTVPWAKACAEAFSKKGLIYDRVLDTGYDFDATLTLAAVAAEQGLDAKVVKRYVGAARGLAGDDESKVEEVERMFGK
jgi:tRNA A-37 threonylcarbamoyl transferase component Bud32